MNRKKLFELIDLGEGLKVEFKQRFSTHEKIAKEMIAFANTRGGHIIFGINDDQSVCGVQSEKGEAELIKMSAEKYCEPPVAYTLYYFEIEDKEIVIAEIPESDFKPHRIQDYQAEMDLSNTQVYVRVKDKSMLASKEMIKILQTNYKKMKLKNYNIGKVEKAAFDCLEKNESITVKQLSDLANVSNRRASRTLINLVRANLLMIHSKDNGESFFTEIG
jgi:predicted HTH transcriptional regulator